MRKTYRKRETSVVTAVRLALETDGLTYRKWGDTQSASAGDWLVDNDGDVYTVTADAFERTYEMVSPGVYRKTGPVWAEVAEEPGAIRTSEGTSAYEAGDYLVFNDADGKDGYAVGREKFERMYEPVDD